MRERRFRYLRDPLFLACVALYLLNRFVIKPGPWPRIEFFHSYFNDLICIPFWLPPLLLLYRRLRLRGHDLPPTFGEISLHLALWSVLFEVVGPRLAVFPHSVADPWDILFYAIGALAAGVIWNL